MSALARWRERRVNAQLISLRLLEADSNPLTADDTSRYYQVLATVLEELDESLTSADKLPASGLDALSARVLHSAGHGIPPAPRSRMHALALHLGDLQCQRARSDGDASGGGAQKPADIRLANALDRVCRALDVRPTHSATGTIDLVSNAVESCGLRAPDPLLSSKDGVAGGVSEPAPACAQVAAALASEYTTRRALLLQRLTVTSRSFADAGARAAGAGDARAARALVRVARAAPPPPAYGYMHAALATRAILGPLRVHSARASQVRDVLMGSVPDRGGRVGAAAKAAARLRPSMAFEERRGQSDAPEARAERTARRHRKKPSRKNRNKQSKFED